MPRSRSCAARWGARFRTAAGTVRRQFSRCRRLSCGHRGGGAVAFSGEFRPRLRCQGLCPWSTRHCAASTIGGVRGRRLCLDPAVATSEGRGLAVRAGVHLARNLRLAARHRPLRHWRPQTRGAGHSGSWRGTSGRPGATGSSLSGTWVWRWKDWIDRRWMRMYTEMRMKLDPSALMRCGGCGAKVGAEVLAGASGGPATQ